MKWLLDEATPDANKVGANQYGERDTLPTAGRPDTAEKVLARLKRDDPELADRVISGEVSKNVHRKCRHVATLLIDLIRSRSELESAASEVHNQLRCPSDAKVAPVLEET